jgi:hypothetical protein
MHRETPPNLNLENMIVLPQNMSMAFMSTHPGDPLLYQKMVNTLILVSKQKVQENSVLMRREI